MRSFQFKLYVPGTEAVDAFGQDWSKDNNYLVPPVSDISNVVKRIESSHVYGALIIPFWKSAEFWPLIQSDGIFKPFIEDFITFNIPKDILQSGRCPFSLLGSSQYKGGMLALKINSRI